MATWFEGDSMRFLDSILKFLDVKHLIHEMRTIWQQCWYCNNLQHVSMKPSREPDRPVVRRTGAAWQHPAPLPAARVVSWWRKHVDMFSSMATSNMWTAGVPHPTACRGNFVMQPRCLQRQFYFKVRGNHTRWSQGVRDRETPCSTWRMMDLMHHFDFTAKWWCDFWKGIVKIWYSAAYSDTCLLPGHYAPQSHLQLSSSTFQRCDILVSLEWQESRSTSTSDSESYSVY